MWRGDMLVKKTVVRLGSMFLSTHLAHVIITFRYATGRSISSNSVAPWSNDPRLLSLKTTNKISIIHFGGRIYLYFLRWLNELLTELSFWKCSSTKCMCWRWGNPHPSSFLHASWLIWAWLYDSICCALRDHLNLTPPKMEPSRTPL